MLEDKTAARRKVERVRKKRMHVKRVEGYVQMAKAWWKERKVKVEIKTSKE